MKVRIGRPRARRRLHQAQRSLRRVALGARHAEVAPHVLFRTAPLLVPEDEHGRAAEAADAADDRLVVAEGAITVQLDELLEEDRGVVEGVRAQRMARELDLLPRRQLGRRPRAAAVGPCARGVMDPDLELRPAKPLLLELGDLASRARRSDARSRAPDGCRSRAACSVYSTLQLVGIGEAAGARLLVEPGALPARVATGGADDGVGHVGRQRQSRGAGRPRSSRPTTGRRRCRPTSCKCGASRRRDRRRA